MSKTVENRLSRIMTTLELKLRTHLQVCESTAEKVFLLAYLEHVLDSVTASWFTYRFDEATKPYFQYPGQEDLGRYVPASITWYELGLIRVRKAIQPHLLELHPQYEIADNNTGLKFKIDFALFYPRTDEIPIKIKVAIECSSNKRTSCTDEQQMHQTEREVFLKSQGWVVARFEGARIIRSDIFDLINEVESIASARDEALYYQTEKVRGNWHLN